MNISTGGPHILLFERDQQLAALLISELQLAGYECHTARTAVEVFDTIARHSIRLVLVNLAQAAAARREFWVALDAQRRDRKVQVFTFRATNLAGYGPRDPDETSQATMADMEIDGMLGLMSLVDAVRARVPGPDNETTMNTMPRMPRAPLSPQPQQNTAQQRPVVQPSQVTPTPSSGTTGAFASSGSTLRAAPLNESGTSTIRGTIPPTPPTYTPPPLSNQGSTGSTAANQATYTEKIRAVLYPNQRTWSSQGGSSLSAASENRPVQDTPSTISPPMPTHSPATPPFNDTSALQRLANGQLGMEGGAESGLAQLSRIAQGFRLTENAPSSQAYQPSQTYQTPQTQTYGSGVTATPPPLPEEIQPRRTNGNTGSQPQQSATSYQQPEASPASFRAPSTADTNGTTTPATAYASNTGSYPAVAPTPARPTTGTGSEKPSSQPLRASPIQDIPLERNSNTPAPASAENARRPDVLSRANYGPQGTQQAQPTAPIPALTSIAPPQPATPKVAASPPSVSIDIEQPETTIHVDARKETVSIQAIEDAVEKWKERNNYSPIDKESAEGRPEKRHGTDFDATTAPSNAMLLDIVQSFPPMPAPAQQASSQAAQPHVLHGRATRSLGTVLLDGHLVPQDRLEVAQNIQRMLRGVDLNYQLGEILLMFKLLTPDQLLAASLVSYGLITTTQISALGRIRQELHAIGLEYDLENLVILFRILTPEQLREVRSSLQS